MSDSQQIHNRVDRRRFLLGLAAASTAAASVPASATSAENPKLLALASQLPGVAAAHRVAAKAYEEMHQRRKRETPLAPDEITELGIGCPRTTRQRGEVEMYSLGGYLYRKGEMHPRRIVRGSWSYSCEISELRRQKRIAKKNGAVAEFLDAEEKIVGLKVQLAKARAYEEAYHDAREASKANHARLYPVRERALLAYAEHVSAIMNEPDWTMEGLVIKAEALIEWGRLDKTEKLHAHIYGADWHASIASSILRHGQGGAA